MPCSATGPRTPLPPLACTSSSQNGNTPVASSGRSDRWPFTPFISFISTVHVGSRCAVYPFQSFLPVLFLPVLFCFVLFCFVFFLLYPCPCSWNAILLFNFSFGLFLCPINKIRKKTGLSLLTAATNDHTSTTPLVPRAFASGYLNSIAREPSSTLFSHAAGTRASRLLS
jgi:hypothetical protein